MVKRILVTISVASVLCFGSAAWAQKLGDCGGADTVVTAKIRVLLQRSDAFSQALASHSVPSLEEARALCTGAQAKAALRLYAQLLLYMEMEDLSVHAVAASVPPAAAGQAAQPPVDRR